MTINGKPAAVAFISPGQINVLAPDDNGTGLGPVQVKNAQGAGDSVLVLQQTAAPALFQFPGAAYAAATHVDGSYVAGPRLVRRAFPALPPKPARPSFCSAPALASPNPPYRPPSLCLPRYRSPVPGICAYASADSTPPSRTLA